MNNESLNGTLVLVRPDLTVDPANGQGKVAIVTYDRVQSKEVYVALNNGSEAVYPPEFLLKLKDKKTILNDLTANGSTMPLANFKDLYKIGLLLERGTNTAHWQSLEVAAHNPGIWDKALQPAKPVEKLGLEKAHSR
ncbi:hypothetical protein SAMN05192574_102208 [Mucilaginibacter gossypiicola]|uniref:Uncharacterized protein n=1 Tax=Mucilaginibacter gossypiicola TaxID=551995 RepID=A0A1H8D641_9SPHI|nr:hypothetical protein [Mucilaginibacter gossypiicola]SEN02264.1 hypothetical protein SAMN05192574_102208 [Mucilaginibacter gossypiicola]